MYSGDIWDIHFLMEIRYDIQLQNYNLPFVNKRIAMDTNVGGNGITLNSH